jgi:GT2 family glycosyltransferase
VTDLSPTGSCTIGIVTVTYNSERVLEDFFDSLAKQTYCHFVLYAIDNASTDRTLEVLARKAAFPVQVVANPDNRGVAEGNNQGIRAALAEGCAYVLLLNNDVVFREDLLSSLLRGLQETHCDIVAPKIYYHDQPNRIWAAGGYFQIWFGRALHYGEGSLDNGQFDGVRTITYAPTCCVLIARGVFERVGLMDSRYFVYWDDVDFMYRAVRSGLTIKYLPQSALWHKVGSLTTAAPSQFSIRYSTRNRVYFVQKFFPRPLALSWIALYRLYLLIRYILGRDSKSHWNLKERAIADGIDFGKH